MKLAKKDVEDVAAVWSTPELMSALSDPADLVAAPVSKPEAVHPPGEGDDQSRGGESRLKSDAPIVEHGRTGYLAEERDADGLLAHLRTIVAQPQMWNGMLRRVRERIERQFSAAQQGRRLAGIYQDMAA